MKTNKTLGKIIAGLALLSLAVTAMAGQGKTLFDKNCTRCHGTDVFTRDDRGVKSLEGLNSRVKQCNLAAKSELNEAQISEVVAYLNKNFYKF